LLNAGFLEVWTYDGCPEAWTPHHRATPNPLGVMSDPDSGLPGNTLVMQHIDRGHRSSGGLGQ
jgi:hypothetical protein